MEKFDEKLELMISRQQIEEKIRKLAIWISARDENEDKDLVLLGVMKGAFMFLPDLARNLSDLNQLDIKVETIKASSYGNTTDSSGEPDIEFTTLEYAKGKNILLVEDIIDRGYTLKYLKEMLLIADAKSVKICALLDKYERRRADINADYVGFTIPDEFVVGYGLDYDEKYRCLPDIHKLTLSKPE